MEAPILRDGCEGLGNDLAQGFALAAKSVRTRKFCRVGIRLFAEGKEPDSVTVRPKAERLWV